MVKIGLIKNGELFKSTSAERHNTPKGLSSGVMSFKPFHMASVKFSNEGLFEGIEHDSPSAEQSNIFGELVDTLKLYAFFDGLKYGFGLQMQTHPIFEPDSLGRKRKMWLGTRQATIDEIVGRDLPAEWNNGIVVSDGDRTYKKKVKFAVNFDQERELNESIVRIMRAVRVREDPAYVMPIVERPHIWKGMDQFIADMMRDSEHFEAVINSVYTAAGYDEAPDFSLYLAHDIVASHDIEEVQMEDVEGRHVCRFKYKPNPKKVIAPGTKTAKKPEPKKVVAKQEEEKKPEPKKPEPAPEGSFEGIFGLDYAIREMRAAIRYFENPQKFIETRGYGLSPGIILYGPPGTGKTMLAKAFAAEAGVPVTIYNAAEVLSKWHGEAEQNLAKLLDETREAGKCVLFIDEFEQLARARGLNAGSSHGTEGRLVNILLTYLQGFGERGDVYLIGATNMIEDIDPALRSSQGGRLKEIEIPLPSYDARKAMLQAAVEKHASKVKIPPFAELDYDAIADESEGFSCRQLVSMDQSLLRTFCDRFYERMDETGQEPPKITTEDWIAEIRKYKPEERVMGFAKRSE